MAAGIVVAENTVLTTAAIDDDKAAVRAGNGQTAEGAVLGRIGHMGLTVVRVEGLGLRPLAAGGRTEARSPRRGGRPHLERRRDGGVRADRRGRRTAAHRPRVSDRSRDPDPARAARRAQRRRAARRVRPRARHHHVDGYPRHDRGDSRVARVGGGHEGGQPKAARAGIPRRELDAGPDSGTAARRPIAGLWAADQPGLGRIAPPTLRGLLVGDVLVSFDGESIENAEDLVTRLRGNRIGKAVPVTVLRGASPVDVSVTVGERPTDRACSGLSRLPSRSELRVFLRGAAEALRPRLASDPNIELVDRIEQAEAVLSLPPASARKTPTIR